MSYLSMYRGDDRELTITASEDLSDTTVEFTARRYLSDTTAAFVKSTADGSITVSGTTATVTIDAADTVDEEPDRPLFWDVQVTDGDGKIHTVAAGRLALLEDVTRPA